MFPCFSLISYPTSHYIFSLIIVEFSASITCTCALRTIHTTYVCMYGQTYACLKKKKEKHFGHLATFWFSTYICDACLCLHLEDEYYIVIKPYKFTTLILANHPGISGTVLETDLASCCPRSVQNCPINYSHGKRVY